MPKLIIALSLMFISFFFAGKQEPHVAAWENVLKKCNTEMYKKYGLRCNRKGGSFCDNIKSLHMFYNYYVDAPPSIEQARMLILQVYQDAYACFMNDPCIQPYLNPNPFPTKEFHIIISFVYRNGELVEGINEIFSVSCVLNEIDYYQFTGYGKPLFTETLEEARTRAQACANQNPKQP